MLDKRLAEMNKKAGEAGTWQLAEDKDAKPIFYNSKTGEQKDAGGIQRSGAQEKKNAAEEKEFGPARGAQQYATTISRTEDLQDLVTNLCRKSSLNLRSPQPDSA